MGFSFGYYLLSDMAGGICLDVLGILDHNEV